MDTRNFVASNFSQLLYQIGLLQNIGQLKVAGMIALCLSCLTCYLCCNNMLQLQMEIYFIYGHPAYPLQVQLQTPFRGTQITDEHYFWNKAMCKIRISVEWLNHWTTWNWTTSILACLMFSQHTNFTVFEGVLGSQIIFTGNFHRERIAQWGYCLQIDLLLQ